MMSLKDRAQGGAQHMVLLLTHQQEMATHSCIPAWKIPYTEEPGRLQSMGSQRVGHDRVTLLTSP